MASFYVLHLVSESWACSLGTSALAFVTSFSRFQLFLRLSVVELPKTAKS